MATHRRRFLQHLALGAAGLAAPAMSLAGDQKHGNRSIQFDWNDPQDNLVGLVKMAGDLNGAPRWWSAQGMIYAMQPGKLTVPLVRVEGARYLRFRKNDAGYEMTTRDWAVFRDLETGEVLDTYDNPYTGETNAVSQLLISRAYSWDMTAEKGQQMPNYTGEAYLIDRPLILPWVEEGDLITVTLPLLVKYANGIVGSEMEHFMGSARELRDPSLSSVRTARQAWIGNSPWLRWMNMGDRPGGTQWHSTGLKHETSAGLRSEFRDAIDALWPGSLEAPETYVKPE